MDRPDLLARIMRLQLDAGLQHEHRHEPNK